MVMMLYTTLQVFRFFRDVTTTKTKKTKKSLVILFNNYLNLGETYFFVFLPLLLSSFF